MLYIEKLKRVKKFRRLEIVFFFWYNLYGDKEYLDSLLERLAKSNFRNRFHLKDKDREYVLEKGIDEIMDHAYNFVDTRLGLLKEKDVSKHLWEVILFLLHNMQQRLVVGDA